jgi:CubicO group peptidase (beta-lactamase class C family)
MRRPVRWWTILFWILIVVFVSVNVAIQITGNTYMYPAVIYNYADIDDLDIFATRTINNENPQPWPVAKDYNKAKLPDSVRKEIEKLKTVAYLIIKNDSIKYEEYWDRYNEKAISNSFSMAKSVVSLLTGIALGEGKIKSLDDPIGNYLPDFSKGQATKVTVRNLLTMSSGSSWEESYSDIFSITTKAYYGSDLKKLIHNEVKIVSEPGKVWYYSSGDPQILSFVLEKATGKHLADYASEKIWTKIGAELPAQWSLDHVDGEEKAYCCIYSTPRDFARIGRLMLDSGAWYSFGQHLVGRQIVPKYYVEEALRPNGLIDSEVPGSKVSVYGYQWWLMKYKSHDIFYMRGLLGQYVFAIPDQRMIVVRLGKKRESVQHDHRPIEIDYLIEGALEMYGKE